MSSREAKSPDPRLLGVWRLVSFSKRGEDGTVSYPFGADAHGLLIYASSGEFSVQLMQRDRPRFAASAQREGTAEEIAAGFKGCISYFGTYELDVDGGFVTHRVEGSLFPNWEGDHMKRYCAFDGDRLTLTTPPMPWAGGTLATGIVVWRRAA